MHEPAPRPITRRQSYRGQRVEVQFRDGTKHIGWINGWGRQVIRVTTAAGIVERAIPTIARVLAF